VLLAGEEGGAGGSGDCVEVGIGEQHEEHGEYKSLRSQEFKNAWLER